MHGQPEMEKTYRSICRNYERPPELMFTTLEFIIDFQSDLLAQSIVLLVAFQQKHVLTANLDAKTQAFFASASLRTSSAYQLDI
jgi:hypothetical protein